jgi:hypothetical protein
MIMPERLAWNLKTGSVGMLFMLQHVGRHEDFVGVHMLKHEQHTWMFCNCLAPVVVALEFGVCWSSNFSLWSSCVQHKLKFELQQVA